MSTNESKDIHERLRELLDREGAVYRVLEHAPEGRTEVIAKIRGNRPEQAIKSIVIQLRFGKEQKRYYLANVPGHRRVDLAGIQAIFNGTDASVAPREKAEQLTGCKMGAIPPFSFNDQLILLADPLIQENEEVVFNAGRLDRSIFMQSADYFRIARPQLMNIASRA
ncbi:MAG TPA: YbaK/EbsC family protein [Anaerolineales bacterium]|nr:YbaK/EbsC family protein [Anaerolineales bacterium]